MVQFHAGWAEEDLSDARLARQHEGMAREIRLRPASDGRCYNSRLQLELIVFLSWEKPTQVVVHGR